MKKQIISKTLICFAAVAFILTACTKEDFAPAEENLAFSSNGPDDISVGGDKTFYRFTLDNGYSGWSNDGVYQLGIVADEKVRAVYIYAEGKYDGWQRLDPKHGTVGGSFDVDAYLRSNLFNSDKACLNVFTEGQFVIFTYGNKYSKIRTDRGTIFRDGSRKSGRLPKGITSVDFLPWNKIPGYRDGAYLGVTKQGFVGAATTIDGEYVVINPSNASGNNVNKDSRSAGKVECLDVITDKRVTFTLKNGNTMTGTAQRSTKEFIKF
ncbi:MAG: hypothetical protein AAF242_02280 [Bacteroidota bacterium]